MSQSSAVNVTPIASSISLNRILPFTSHLLSLILIITVSSSDDIGSISFKSPTISSNKSKRVTIPTTPPYSSNTIAIDCFDCFIFLKSTSAFVVSITKYGAEITESITISLLFSFNLK